MKQHSTPIIIKNRKAQTLERVSLNSASYNEDWIQQLCFNNPTLLPVEEIEPIFGGMIPICRELTTESGNADLIYINEYGLITIGECKLWRNPEARRKAVGQILDYAKDLAKWDYSKFETECLKSAKCIENSLFNVVQKYYPDIEESKFVDGVQNNLRKGRFLLAIIGDGIRENMEELANYIHRNGNLSFTLALIELPIFKNPSEDEIIVTPRILAKTKEIERIIYRISDKVTEENIQIEQRKEVSQTISETIFFERLQNAIGVININKLKDFIETLSSKLNVITKLGRGKRLSLNLKSGDDTLNFASIQETGEVWFYGIVNKTEELGSKKIGVDYLQKLAKAVNGKFDDSYKEWNWCIKREGKYISIIEYLNIQKKWIEIIAETLDEINRLDENN